MLFGLLTTRGKMIVNWDYCTDLVYPEYPDGLREGFYQVT